MFYIVLTKKQNVNKIRETAMRKNTNQTMLFKEISGKKVEVDFNGGEVSSDAGLLFLRETESKIGIINKVANAIHDKRHPSYVKHQIVQLLTQRVFLHRSPSDKLPQVMKMLMIVMILRATLF